MTPRWLWLINYIYLQRIYNTNPFMRLQRLGLGLWFRIENQSCTCTKLPLKGMATLLKIVSTKAYIHIKLVHRCIKNHFHSLLMRTCDYCWVGGGGRQHPIHYIIISHNFCCKWIKYSILWCQPCLNSFIWTNFHIAYTKKTKLSVLNHFFNMTDFDTYK